MTNHEIIEYAKCAKDPIYFLNNYGYVYDINVSKVNRLKCFEYQEKVIKNYLKYQNNIILKSRQCLPEDALINTPSGNKKLKDLFKDDLVYSYNFKNEKAEIDFITEKFECGIVQCYKVKFQDGKEIEVGENHPFYCINKKNWVNASSLESEDEILFRNFENKSLVGGENVVVSIEKTIEKECFDISVNKNENYFIEGLLSHNTGLSVITAGFVAWTLLFKIDQKILIVANDQSGAVRFLETVKQYFQFLPKFIYDPEKVGVKDNDKFFSIINPEGKINFAKAVASSKNAGRGESLTMLILDETAFIEHADDIWMAAGLALSATQGKCIMISTPQGTNNVYHKTWTLAKKAEATGEFDPKKHFKTFQIHWTEHPLYSKGMEQKIDEYGRTFWTSPWYEGECERLQHDSVKIAQELDLSFEGSRQLVIDAHIIEKYKKSIIFKKPLCYYDYTRTDDKFIDTKTNFFVWKKPEPNRSYLLGSDVGRGDSNDYSTIQVFDAETCEQVAEFEGKLPPDVFADVIYAIGKDYNWAYSVIECNSFGLATTLRFQNTLKYPIDRIYHSKSIKKMVNSVARVKIEENEEIPGIQTTPTTRPLIITSLKTYMREGKIKLHSFRLLDQFDTFIYNGTKPEHSAGANDDLIFALAILLFARDTEYSSIILTQNVVHAMINSMSRSVTPYNEVVNFDNKKNTGIITTSQNKKAGDDDNDLSWLFGSIST